MAAAAKFDNPMHEAWFQSLKGIDTHTRHDRAFMAPVIGILVENGFRSIAELKGATSEHVQHQRAEGVLPVHKACPSSSVAVGKAMMVRQCWWQTQTQ